MQITTTQKLVAEGLGTFVLVFFGVGTALMWQGDPLITALAFGLSVMVMVYALGRVSGGHFNPAVSVGLAMGGRIAWSEVPKYAGAQVLGGIVAACALFGLKQGGPYFDTTGNFGQNVFGSEGGWEWWSVFLLELLLTAIFVFVILAVTDTRNNANTGQAPLAIGVTLAVIHMASIGADGTSVNPARSIGPALFAGSDSIIQLWLFILAPLVGGVLAGLVYPAVYGHGEDPVVGSGRPRRGPAAATPGYDPYAQPWTPEQLAAAGWTPEQIQTWQQQQGYAPQTPAPQTPAPQSNPQTPAPQASPQSPAPSWPEGGDPERTQIRE